MDNILRFLQKYWDLILGVLVIGYHYKVKDTYGMVTFNSVFLLGGIALVIYHFVKNILKYNSYTNKIVKGVNMFIILGVVIFIFVESAIIMFPKSDNSKSDYVIVLGAGIRGEQISLSLKQRLDKVIEYNKFNKDVPIVVSGGQGPGEDITEAEAMKRYLVSQGISENNIIMEDKSRSTSENLAFSKVRIQDNSNKEINNINVKIVTSDFHALRSKMLAKKEGYETVSFYTNKTIPLLAPIMYTREFFAVFKSFIFD